MQRQDSTHPTGVAQVEGTPESKQIARARDRKAAAALEMKLEGATWAEIAAALGYPTARYALTATEQALEKQLLGTDRAFLRNIVGLRMETMLRGVWRGAVPGENGEVDFDCYDRALKTLVEYRRLYGLDAPTEVIVHSPSEADLLRWAEEHYGGDGPQVQEYDIIAGEAEEAAAESMAELT